MGLHRTHAAHGSLSTDHPFIAMTTGQRARSARSIARQGSLAVQESGPLSGPTRQQPVVTAASGRDLTSLTVDSCQIPRRVPIHTTGPVFSWLCVELGGRPAPIWRFT